MEKYIGMDVHATSCTAAVMNAQGKRLGSHVIATSGAALVEFLKTQTGTIHLCIEEGTQSTWLAEILSPHVEQMVVTHVSESRGQKNDERDAFTLAERLRTGTLETCVFKQVGRFGTLRQLVRAHAMIVQDTARVQHRIKSLLRSRGLPATGKSMYNTARRAEYLAALPASARHAAELLFAQYDAVVPIRDRAHKELVAEAHRHPETRWLESCPGIGEIRAAQIAAVVVEPERFRTRRQFWSYCGLGIVMRSSADWVQTAQGKWTRAQVKQTRGLNQNHNHMLKYVFKGAATSVLQIQNSQEPLRASYERMLAGGTKPNLAKVTLARKLAAIALALWKKKEVYDPAKWTTTS
jgi:transposase